MSSCVPNARTLHLLVVGGDETAFDDRFRRLRVVGGLKEGDDPGGKGEGVASVDHSGRCSAWFCVEEMSERFDERGKDQPTWISVDAEKLDHSREKQIREPFVVVLHSREDGRPDGGELV
jgi:hypothetical protein